MIEYRYNKSGMLVLLGILMLTLGACSSTSVVREWQDEAVDAGYKHFFIVGISDSQQNRRIFENLVVGDLQALGVDATPSYQHISSKVTIERETVVEAIRGKDYDAVLVTYLVSTDAELAHHDSPVGETYSGSSDTNMLSATLLATRGRFTIDEVVELKHDLYDIRRRALVWSMQTRTKAPDSIDHLMMEVAETVTDGLQDDGKIAPGNPAATDGR